MGALKKQNEVFTNYSKAIRGNLKRHTSQISKEHPCQECGSDDGNELLCGHVTCASCIKKSCELLAEWLRVRDPEIYKMLLLQENEIGYYICAACTVPSAVAIDELNFMYSPLLSTESPPLVWRVYDAYQNNRKIPFGDYTAGALLPTDRIEWSTESGSDLSKVSDDDFPSDKEFRFICPWHCGPWSYRGNWSTPTPWASKTAPHKFVRRRRWIRLAINARSTAQLRRDHRTVLVVPRSIASTFSKNEEDNAHSVWPAGYCAPWIGHTACTISNEDISSEVEEVADVIWECVPVIE